MSSSVRAGKRRRPPGEKRIDMTRYQSSSISLAGGDNRIRADADRLTARALEAAGRRSFSDRSFEMPLERLLAALDAEADLNAFGRYAVRLDVMRSLKNLLRLDAAEEADPKVRQQCIERPVFITGLPRSGTTFLHALLVQNPAAAAPLSWQLAYPCAPRGRSLGAGLCRAWIEAQFRLFRALAPELQDLHPIAAGAPQECTDITAQVFQSLRFDTMYRVPSYQSWLQKHGHLSAYIFHRRFLRHLGAQAPGRRWILKSPDHVFALSEIRTVYPDAQFVFVHRDPVSVLASVAKLTEVLRRPFARTIDRREIGRQVRASWIEGANRMIAAAASSKAILHLHYKQLVAAPIETAEALFRHCGLCVSAEAKERMSAWARRAPDGRKRRSPYDLATFGLDAADLRAQFAHYVEAFGVQPDREISDAAGPGA